MNAESLPIARRFTSPSRLPAAATASATSSRAGFPPRLFFSIARSTVARVAEPRSGKRAKCVLNTSYVSPDIAASSGAFSRTFTAHVHHAAALLVALASSSPARAPASFLPANDRHALSTIVSSLSSPGIPPSPSITIDPLTSRRCVICSSATVMSASRSDSRICPRPCTGHSACSSSATSNGSLISYGGDGHRVLKTPRSPFGAPPRHRSTRVRVCGDTPLGAKIKEHTRRSCWINLYQ